MFILGPPSIFEVALFNHRYTTLPSLFAHILSGFLALTIIYIQLFHACLSARYAQIRRVLRLLTVREGSTMLHVNG